MRLTLRYGNAENLKGFNEAAAFLPELMTRAPKKLTRQQIQDALDKNLARLGRGMGGRMMKGIRRPSAWSSTTFTLETKRANLPAALEILRQVLREPTLPASEFEIMKAEAVSAPNRVARTPSVWL